MASAVSATQGISASYQANFAAMQQQLIQQLFQAAGGSSSNGTISQTQFENFYSRFMGTTSQTTGATQASKAAADQLFQQVNTTGTGQLTMSQFAAALKQMMAEKVQGPHHHHSTGASGAMANSASQNVSQTGSSSGSNSAMALIDSLLAAANQNATGQAAQAQNSGGVEFIA